MADEEFQRVIRKVFWRLIPLCILCFLMNYIDRTNIAMAESSMIATVHGFTDSVYKFASAIFYIPYCLCELPSNLLQHRFGPRRWIARIMISWGIVSTCMIFTAGPNSFYTIRILLGIAEAGFFPGVLLYLSYWVPHRHRARASALFFVSQAVAQLMGNALGGVILYTAEKYHLPGLPWQWLFILEGVPSILMGIVVLFVLTDRPAQAKWLTDSEKKLLMDVLAKEKAEMTGARMSQDSKLTAAATGAAPAGHRATDFAHAVKSPYVWLFSFLYTMMVLGYVPANILMPRIFKNVLVQSGVVILPPAAGSATAAIAAVHPTPDYLVSLYQGLLAAIPFGIAAVVMVIVARNSDKHKERKYHITAMCALMSIGLTLASIAPQVWTGNWMTVWTLVGMSLATIGWFGSFAIFWSVPPQFLTGIAVAAALAIINSIGNIGNFVGPFTQQHAGWTDQTFMLVAAGCAAVGVVVTLLIRFPKFGEAGETAAEKLAATRTI